MSARAFAVSIEEWDGRHGRWTEFLELVRALDVPPAWALCDERRAAGRHALVALVEDRPVGLLVFAVQPIGPPDGCPPLVEDGKELEEAKITAFAVHRDARERGIGTALQRRVLARAQELGCYQVRSQSDAGNDANYRVKLRLGFAAHPAVRQIGDERRPGVYWVKSLRGQCGS